MILFLGFILGVLLGFVSSTYSIKKKQEFVSIMSDRKYWEKKIKTSGIKQAYNEFKQSYKDQPQAHNALHIFSETIYKNAGLSGIVYCDDTFAMGCYHGFYIAAIGNEGLQVSKKLDEICIKKFGKRQSGCQHGIGHGILEYMGHKNLSKALDICSTLTWQGKIFGCISGVFMEFNFPLSEKKSGPSIREFTINRPFYPCDTVEARYKTSCYFEIGQYLQSIYKNDYGKLGQMCLGLDNQEFQKYCFLGLGWYAPQGFSYNMDEVVQACNLMPNESSSILCKVSAAHELRGDVKGGQVSIDRVCDGVSEKFWQSCRLNSFFEENKVIFN